MVPVIEFTDASSGRTLLKKSVKGDVLIDLAPRDSYKVGIDIRNDASNIDAAIGLQEQTLGRRNKINVSVKPDSLGDVLTTTRWLLDTGYQSNSPVVANDVLISLIS